MGRRKPSSGAPPPPATPAISGAPPAATRILKNDKKLDAPGFPARGFLNKKGAGTTNAATPASIASSPATTAQGGTVCAISSNPRLPQQAIGSNSGGTAFLGGNSSDVLSKNSIEVDQNVIKVTSDASLGFVESENVGNVEKNSVDPVASKKGWASLFGLNINENKGFKLSENFTGVTSAGVVLDEGDRQDNAKFFFRLVGYFSPRFPGLDALKQLVKNWDCKCKSYQHASNWTVFTFDKEVDMLKVLEGGPYFIYGKSLYLKKMPSMFDFGWSGHTILPVWVQLPNLSLDFWNEKALGKLCSFIGKPLHTDAATKEQQNLSFARALVEVDVSMVLPTEMPVTYPDKIVRTQKFFYEDVPKFCQTCRKMGHLTDTCSSESSPKLYVKKTQKPSLKPIQNVQKPAASRPATQKKKHKNVATTTEWVVQGKKNKGKAHAETEEVKEKVSADVGNEGDEEMEDMREYGTDRGASDYVPTDGGDDEDEDEEDDGDEDDEESDDSSEDEGEPEIDRDTVVPTEAEIAEFFRTMDAMDGDPGASVVDAGATVIALGANDKSVGIKNNTNGQKGAKMTTTSLSPLTLADIPIQEDKRAKKKTMQEELVLLRIEAKKKEDAWKAEREATLTRSRAKVAKRGD